MLITSGALDAIYRGFSLAFKGAFDGAETQWQNIATLAPSSTRSNTYAWLTQAPRMREWVGDRVLKSLSAYAYVIENRKFESTIEVGRTDIEDDQIGMFGGLVADMGRAAAEFPDELLFALLAQGFGLPCYDGQNFFDDEHPSGADGATLTRNYQDGGSEAWYLLDTSRALKPLIYQERTKPEFAAITRPDDERVFMRDDYLYGTRLRANAGFGLWQLAFASKAPLTAANYVAVRTAMMSLRGDEGRLLGVKPTTLVVPPTLEEPARTLLNSATIAGSTNPWAGSASLIVSPWLVA